jgi:hypothetical protein
VQEIGDKQSFEALRHRADVKEVVDLPAALSPVKVADDGTTPAHWAAKRSRSPTPPPPGTRSARSPPI